MNASTFLKKLQNIPQQNLLEVKGLGEVLVANFTEFLQSDRYQKLLADFENLEAKNTGLTITEIPKNREVGDLVGKIICITGSFEISREEIKKQLELRGAKVTNSVTKNVDILLAGDKAGSKFDKATELGVRIINSIEEIS